MPLRGTTSGLGDTHDVDGSLSWRNRGGEMDAWMSNVKMRTL